AEDGIRDKLVTGVQTCALPISVINGTAFVELGPGAERLLVLGIIWAIAGLNIIGIRENARVTFGIFVAAAFVFVNLIALGVLNMEPSSPARMWQSGVEVYQALHHHTLAHAVSVITIGVASCVLAYSGIESVIQTAGLVESWRDIGKAYWFLALTVGIVTPVGSALALAAPIDLAQHEGDLITYWATVVGNVPFGVVVGLFGSVILIMAVNTAYVASSELLERVAHRHRFASLTVTNRRESLYRIHVLNGLMYTAIIFLTQGSQAVLAEMYAVGLLASFCINVGCLLIYRYFQGTKEIREYHTSRVGTLLLEAILLACFVYLALHKPYGTGLWAGVVTVLVAAGIPFSRRYGPEVAQVRRSDYQMEMLLALGEVDGPLHVYFRRPGEVEAAESRPGTVYITFFSPRRPMPDRVAPNHYRFPIHGGSLYRSIQAILALLQEELDGREVHVHFGWPTSSGLEDARLDPRRAETAVQQLEVHERDAVIVAAVEEERRLRDARQLRSHGDLQPEELRDARERGHAIAPARGAHGGVRDVGAVRLRDHREPRGKQARDERHPAHTGVAQPERGSAEDERGHVRRARRGQVQRKAAAHRHAGHREPPRRRPQVGHPRLDRG